LLEKKYAHRLGCREFFNEDYIMGHKFFTELDWDELKAGISNPLFSPDVRIIITSQKILCYELRSYDG